MHVTSPGRHGTLVYEESRRLWTSSLPCPTTCGEKGMEFHDFHPNEVWKASYSTGKAIAQYEVMRWKNLHETIGLKRQSESLTLSLS